jgi:hypothetical protein
LISDGPIIALCLLLLSQIPFWLQLRVSPPPSSLQP